MELDEYTGYLKKFYAQQIEQRHLGMSKKLSYPSQIIQNFTLINILFLLLDLIDYFCIIF
jgi:hypothetical protein